MTIVRNTILRVCLLLMFAALLAAPSSAVDPATPQAAARVLDLRTFERLQGATESSMSTLGMLMYQAPAAATVAFDFQKTQLTKAGWKELPGGYHDPNNHSAQFTKDDFQLFVSASAVTGDPDKEGWSHVSLINNGNVRADTLPVPQGVKPFASWGGAASYLTETSVDEVADQCRQLLTSADWTPYGSAGSDETSIMYFKTNGIRLMVWVSKAPAQGNQTMIRYSTEQLSADLPVPPDAPDPRYDDSDKSLRFDYPGEDTAPVVKYYRNALTKLGWKATTDNPITDANQRTGFLIFRNSASDMIKLDLQHFTDIVRVKVEYDTADEVREMDRRLAAEAAKRRRAEQEAAKIAALNNRQKPKSAAESGLGDIDSFPDTNDLGALLKAAQKMTDDAIGEATNAVNEIGQAKLQAAPNGPVSVADIAIPEGAGVDYNKITKMIMVKSADDVATLAAFFLDALPDRGWQADGSPLVTDDTAILKFARGNATLTIMANREGSGSEATVINKGVNWEKVPPSRAATIKGSKVAKADDEPTDMSEDEVDMSEADQTKPVRLKYSGKISSDQQLQKGVMVRAGGENFTLAYGVAYQSVEDGLQQTEVLLSAKPISVDKLVALLNNGKDGGDALGFDPQLKLSYDADGKLTYLFLYADGLSVNLGGQGDDKIESSLKIDRDRARGNARLIEPGKLFDNEYSFTAPFDVIVIAGKMEPAGGNPGDSNDALQGEDFHGMPVPLIATNRASSGTNFRNLIVVTVPAPLDSVLTFYRDELAKTGWKEETQGAKVNGDQATLAFSSNEGTLGVTLNQLDGETETTLSVRYPAKAQAAGIAPQAGKGRLILGNADSREAVILINGQPYKVAAGKGAEDPKEGVSLHVLPGNYNVTIKMSGQADQTEKIKIAIGETWGVIVLPEGGLFSDQVY